MIRVIAARELRAIFGSPLAWAVLAIMDLVLAWIFLNRVDAFLALQSRIALLPNAPGATQLVMAPVFAAAALLLLMLTPMLTMRLMAEERRAQTLPLLMSAPLGMTELVLGKFLGLLAFLGLVVLLPAAMAASLAAGARPDWALVACNVAGLFMLAACFAALGLYASCVTTQPAMAAVATLGALLGLWIVDANLTDPQAWLRWLSLLRRFENFNRGVLDSYDVAYLLLFVAVFLALAVKRLDSERLRG